MLHHRNCLDGAFVVGVRSILTTVVGEGKRLVLLLAEVRPELAEDLLKALGFPWPGARSPMGTRIDP
jgi:hypothetical protein